MIATCIALAIWTSGLLYMTTKNEKKRLLESDNEAQGVEDKGSEDQEVKV